MFILLENAVKHSVSDSVIDINFNEMEDYMEVSIENRGAKIETDEIERLTVRGYRGKNTSTKGTGVGLSLAKEIFEQHNCLFNIKVTDINKYESLFFVTIRFNYSK